jgi:hypothetical protein
MDAAPDNRPADRSGAIAGDRNVEVTPGKITSQCLELRLLDEVSIDLVPVLLGSGVPSSTSSRPRRSCSMGRAWSSRASG